jgi:hypothetical protein
MTTRRNAVKFIAGSAVGVMFTPAPWKLIRDTALLSENWPGIPQPEAGPVTTKTTRCTLCPGGCAVKARCVSDRPVSLAGAEGGLCPLGVTAHHLPYHPRRLRQGPVPDARAAVDSALARGARPAVLDLRPGRPAAPAYRQAMAARNGFYLAPPEPPVTVDPAAAKAVISMGVPLFEGWLPPARVFASRDRFRLVQIEPALSRTGALADQWLPSCDDVPALARKLAADGPVLVVDPLMSPAVVALNRELGGPIHDREDQTAGTLASVPDAAIGVLFTWWRDGYARHTRLALPTPVYPEPDLFKPPDGTVDPVAFVTGAPATAGAGHALPGSMCAAATPLFTKLYQESGLLLAPGQVALPPAAGFAAKDRAYLETSRGRMPVEVVLDPGLPPGRIRFLPTPESIDLCGSEEPKVVRA